MRKYDFNNQEKTLLDSLDIDKVTSLIMSLEPHNMGVGLCIIEGVGLPQKLITEAFIVYKMSEDAEIRKKAYQLLKAKASPELLQVIKNRSRLNKKGTLSYKDKKKYEQLLIDYTKDSGLDIGKLAYALYMRNNICMPLALQFAHFEYQKNMLAKNIKNNALSLGDSAQLKVFPMALLAFKALRSIQIRVRIGEWKNDIWHKNNDFVIPKELIQLENLAELEIMYYGFETLPLETLAAMKKLKRLVLYIGKDYSIEGAKAALAHIPDLHISSCIED